MTSHPKNNSVSQQETASRQTRHKAKINPVETQRDASESILQKRGASNPLENASGLSSPSSTKGSEAKFTKSAPKKTVSKHKEKKTSRELKPQKQLQQEKRSGAIADFTETFDYYNEQADLKFDQFEDFTPDEVSRIIADFGKCIQACIKYAEGIGMDGILAKDTYANFKARMTALTDRKKQAELSIDVHREANMSNYDRKQQKIQVNHSKKLLDDSIQAVIVRDASFHQVVKDQPLGIIDKPLPDEIDVTKVRATETRARLDAPMAPNEEQKGDPVSVTKPKLNNRETLKKAAKKDVAKLQASNKIDIDETPSLTSSPEGAGKGLRQKIPRGAKSKITNLSEVNLDDEGSDKYMSDEDDQDGSSTKKMSRFTKGNSAANSAAITAQKRLREQMEALVSSYAGLPADLQESIINGVLVSYQKDTALFKNYFRSQVDDCVENVRDLMKNQEATQREEAVKAVFAPLPADVCIYAHLRCAREIPGFAQLELVHKTLMHHLLVHDYKEAIEPELRYAGVSLVQTLVAWLHKDKRVGQHSKDHSCFILFAFSVGAHAEIAKLIKLSVKSDSKIAFVDMNARYNADFKTALRTIKFADDVIPDLLLYSKTLFQPNVFRYLNNKIADVQKKYVCVLKHLSTHKDVELSILNRFDKFMKASCFDAIFRTEGHHPVDMDVAELNLIMHTLVNLPQKLIWNFFEENTDPASWAQQAPAYAQSALAEEAVDARLTLQQATKFIQDFLQKQHQTDVKKQPTARHVPLDAAFASAYMNVCKQVSQALPNQQYKHDIYQAYAASMCQLLSSRHQVTMVTMPTGSGKTYVIGLLYHFMRDIVLNLNQGTVVNTSHTQIEGVKLGGKNLKYVAVVPNELLKTQMIGMIGSLCWDLVIATPAEFYELHYKNFDVLFIDEADQFFIERSLIAPTDSKLCGAWMLLSGKNKANQKIICFSASKEDNISHLVKAIVAPRDCTEIDFKSEMALVTKLASQSVDHVYCRRLDDRPEWCGEAVQIVDVAQNCIDHFYEKEPLIVFVDTKDDAKTLADFCTDKGFSHYTVDDVDRLLLKDRGVLILLSEHARGVNTQFKVTARVIIACKIISKAHYIQMIGRSSRNRGINYATVLLDLDPDYDWRYMLQVWLKRSSDKIKHLITMIKHVQVTINDDETKLAFAVHSCSKCPMTTEQLDKALDEYPESMRDMADLERQVHQDDLQQLATAQAKFSNEFITKQRLQRNKAVDEQRERDEQERLKNDPTYQLNLRWEAQEKQWQQQRKEMLAMIELQQRQQQQQPQPIQLVVNQTMNNTPPHQSSNKASPQQAVVDEEMQEKTPPSE